MINTKPKENYINCWTIDLFQVETYDFCFVDFSSVIFFRSTSDNLLAAVFLYLSLKKKTRDHSKANNE